MNKLPLLLLLLITNNFFSQEIINSFPLELKSNRDVFQVVNDSTKQTAFFISDRKTVKKYLLNEQMEIIDTISTERPDTKYKDILGFSLSKSNETIYWASKNKEKICAQSFDLKKRKITLNEFEINVDSSREKYLQVFSENSKFYILSLVRESNSLKLYEFDGKEINRQIVDFSPFKCYQSNTEIANISKIFLKSIGEFAEIEEPYKLPRINSEIPVSLIESSKKRKCYSNSKEIIITIDFSDFVTQIFTINLKTFELKLNNVKKTIFQDTGIKDVKTNSFLIDGKLLQLVLTESIMNLALKDYTSTIIKEYVINENEKFNINNTKFVRQNYMGSERELETTSQFLRKIARSNIGISAYKLNNNYLITLGSVTAEKSMPLLPEFNGFSNTPTTNNILLHPINYVGMNYLKYKYRRTISTNCLFDYNLNHINGELLPIAFDKIIDFKKTDIDINVETIYVMDKVYYLGNYNSTVKKYELRKFTD